MPRAPIPEFAPGETPMPYSILLHSTEGGADKVYQVSIEPRDAGFVVNYQNGRRGGTLSSGTKTRAPVSYAEARTTATKLMMEKIAKSGYNPIGTGGTVEVLDRPTDTGHRPQLLVPVTEEEDIERLLNDDGFVAEEKHNGDRRLLKRERETYTAISKRGHTVPMTTIIKNDLAALRNDVMIDGEQIGDVVYVWDILTINGTDVRARPLSERLNILAAACMGSTQIRVTRTAFGTAAKRALLDEVRGRTGEGIVFKRLDAPYQSGRIPGMQFKFKLTNTLSAIVSHHNALRSVGLFLLDEHGERVSVGNVTIPGTIPIPPVNSIIEVRYLYAYRNGSLFQPAYLGPRDDVDEGECLLDQRVFAPET